MQALKFLRQSDRVILIRGPRRLRSPGLDVVHRGLGHRTLRGGEHHGAANIGHGILYGELRRRLDSNCRRRKWLGLLDCRYTALQLPQSQPCVLCLVPSSQSSSLSLYQRMAPTAPRRLRAASLSHHLPTAVRAPVATPASLAAFMRPSTLSPREAQPHPQHPNASFSTPAVTKDRRTSPQHCGHH